MAVAVRDHARARGPRLGRQRLARGRCRRSRRAASRRARSARRKRRPARPARRGRSRAAPQAGRAAADHTRVDDLVRRDGGGRVGRGERARAAHLTHHLQEHGVAGPAARHQRVVVHAAGNNQSAAAQHVDVGARKRVLALAGQPVARRRPCRPAGSGGRRCACCTTRSDRRGRRGPAGGGTWATAPACGCRRRTAPPRRARRRAPEPAFPRSRLPPARPPAARPQIPAGSVSRATL